MDSNLPKEYAILAFSFLIHCHQKVEKLYTLIDYHIKKKMWAHGFNKCELLTWKVLRKKKKKKFKKNGFREMNLKKYIKNNLLALN